MASVFPAYLTLNGCLIYGGHYRYVTSFTHHDLKEDPFGVDISTLAELLKKDSF